MTGRALSPEHVCTPHCDERGHYPAPGRTPSVVEWVHAFDDTDCFDGSVERDQRYAGTHWCAEGREVRMTGVTAPARTPS